MKIEVGESLILSWLKHVKNCQIVQLNWKPSTKAWETNHETTIEDIITNVQSKYQEEYSYDLFKQNANTSQIIQQGEIDVFGLELDGNTISNLYAVDVAFHENGLNYGSKDVTISRVLKKIVRMAVTIYGYFNNKNATIIFASPKINNSILSDLSPHIKGINNYINDTWQLDFKFQLICNEDFKDKILSSVEMISSEVSDTSELFLRSIQLVNLFNKSTRTITKSPPIKTDIETPIGDSLGDIKIGTLVRTTLPELLTTKIISQSELLNLQNEQYCKENFGVNYPILRKINPNLSIKENRMVGDYTRYYAFTTKFKGDSYLITSEWFDRNKSLYLVWLNSQKNRSANSG